MTRPTRPMWTTTTRRLATFGLLCGALVACEAATDTPAGADADTPAAAKPGDTKPADSTPPAPEVAAPDASADPAPASDPTTDDLDPKVSKAASIAREIEASPRDADAILQKHGLDRDGLDTLMYEIARNPELSRAYRDARTS